MKVKKEVFVNFLKGVSDILHDDVERDGMEMSIDEWFDLLKEQWVCSPMYNMLVKEISDGR